MAREFAKSFYNSKEWERTRDYILHRDRYLCVLCEQPAVEVHHKIPLSPQNIWNTKITLNPDNLISLCKDCHFAQHRGHHGKGRQNEEHYAYTFNENGILIPKTSCN